MAAKVKGFLKDNRRPICLVIGFLFLSLFLMPTSIIHGYMNWWDTNAMLTMGKALLHGLVPFKDLFEQRGPYMYFLMALANLISPKTPFYGVYVLELIQMAFMSYLLFRIYRRFASKRASDWLVFFSLIFLLECPPYFQGGSPEVFSLLSLTYLLYLVFLFSDKRLSNWQLIIAGMMFGYLIWLKYALIGAFVGFYLVIGFRELKKKHFLEFMRLVAYSLIGVFLITLPVLLYFYFNQALGILFHDYFVVNLGYGSMSDGILLKLLYVFYLQATIFFSYNLLIVLFIPVMVLIWRAYHKKYRKICFSLFFIIMISMIGNYYAGINGLSYDLPFMYLMIPLCLLSAYQLFACRRSAPKVFKDVMRAWILMIIVLPLILSGSILLHRRYLERVINLPVQIETLGYQNPKKAVYGQIGLYIKKHGKGKLVDLNVVDNGFYLASGQLPRTRYWEQTMLAYGAVPSLTYGQYRQVAKKIPKYIVDGYMGTITEQTQRASVYPQDYKIWKFFYDGHYHSQIVPKALLKYYRPVVYSKLNILYPLQKTDDYDKHMNNRFYYILFVRKD